MTAREQDFTMNTGESKRVDVDSTTDEDDGGDLDMTGFNELTWVLKSGRGEKPVTEKAESSSSDVTVDDASIGAYHVDIVPGDTNTLLGPRSEETFYHRVRLEDSAGKESDLLEGEITIKAN